MRPFIQKAKEILQMFFLAAILAIFSFLLAVSTHALSGPFELLSKHSGTLRSADLLKSFLGKVQTMSIWDWLPFAIIFLIVFVAGARACMEDG